MKTKLWFMMVFGLVAGSVGADIVVGDKSFEDDVTTSAIPIRDSTVTAWDTHSAGIYPDIRDEDYWAMPPHDGNQVGFLGAGTIYQNFSDTYVEGYTYSISYWMQRSSGSSGTTYAYFTNADDTTDYGGDTLSGEADHSRTPVTGEWVQGTVTYTASADDEGDSIGFGIYGSSYVYVDDFSDITVYGSGSNTTIISVAPYGAGVVELVFDSSPSLSMSYLAKRTNLNSGSWDYARYSINGVAPFELTDLSDSISAVGRGVVYLDGSDPTAFFGVSAWESLLVNGSFQEGSNGWILPSPYTIDYSSGRDGTESLSYERTSPGEYSLASQSFIVEPGRRYRFGTWMKTEGVENGAARMCMEFYNKTTGAWAKGAYPYGIGNTTGWTWIEAMVRVRMDFSTNASVSLYLDRGATGKAWFDGAKLILDDQVWGNMFLIEPANERLTPLNGQISMRAYIEGDEPEQLDCMLWLSAGETQLEFEIPVTNGMVSVDLGSLPEGDAILRAQLFDGEGKEIGEKSFPLTVVPPVEVPTNACMIDGMGRAVVDGTPYLPVGLYMRNIHTNEVDEIAQSPFNCLMPYQSKNATLDARDTPSVETINAALDHCHTKGIKIIFSTKDFYPWLEDTFPQSWMGVSGSDAVVESIVENFRTHPALLAWYINDESYEDKMGQLLARRRLVNGLDSFHPTWGVLYQFEVLPMYGGTCEIMGVDPYPLEPDADDMKLVDFSLDMADETALPTWVVPQAFNWGVYRAPNDPEEFARYRSPTEAEMRAYSILSALRGAKGFVFYSYFDMDKPPLTQADRDVFWPKLCNVGQMLRDLEPFLLSDIEPIKPVVEVSEGDVQATEFHDADGHVRILVAGVGPGSSTAVIQTDPGTPLTSLYGLCTSLGGGEYEFSGEGACSDILTSE